jgi:hypothetical protein
LHPKNADFKAPQPGNIGGVKPEPANMAKPADNAVRETCSTDENQEDRNESVKGNDTPSPVADMEIEPEENYQPGRQVDGEFEGEPGYYIPGMGAENLFGPSVEEEEVEKAWSPEAREAAAEARRNNASARSRGEGGPTNVSHNPFAEEDFEPAKPVAVKPAVRPAMPDQGRRAA